MEKPTIRKAQESNISWVNSQYDDIGFKQSNLKSDQTFILEYQGTSVALGRLSHIDEQSAELGGIYVLPSFRGLKFAEIIVQYLVDLKTNHSSIYCLPFSKLDAFYKRFGFRDLKEDEKNRVPLAVSEKLKWCNETYEDKTLLLIMTRIRPE